MEVTLLIKLNGQLKIIFWLLHCYLINRKDALKEDGAT